MFKQLGNMLGGGREVYELRALEDPVAMKASWDPLVSGGWNFCTHRLSPNNGKREMKVSPAAHLFCYFCICFGAIVSHLMAWILNEPSAVTSGNIPTWMVPILPLSFSIFGGGLLWWLYRKNVSFDKKKGTYTFQGKSLPLHEIHAIQLIQECCAGRERIYLSYEMNLILKTGERFNVTDHASLRAIRIDGRNLAEYLGIPAWDLIDYEIRAATH